MAPKYQMVADSLRTDILDGVYQKRMLLPTEQLLCQQFQVSRQTVRQALALLVSEGLIERRQGSGSHIRDRSKPAPMPHRSIAVITTYISDYIFPSILREVENVLSDHNSAPLLFATQNQVSNERKVLNTLLDLTSLDGVLVEGTKTGLPNPNLDLYRRLIDRGVPLVFMNGNYPELTDSLSVLDDNAAGGRMLVDYLHQKGHQRIAGHLQKRRHPGPTSATPAMPTPCAPWASPSRTSRSSGTARRPRNPCFWTGRGSSTWSRSSPAIRRWCATTTRIASRLVAQLVKRGISIPEDMAVVSFDNSQYSEMTTPRITSLSHGTHNVGRMAAELLMHLFEGVPCQSQVAPWTLVQKESS